MSSSKILLVDDDALMRRGLAFHLEQAGYQVIAAEDAESALVIARLQAPDLVLLDINLPGMDGITALQHFKQQSNTPVIYLTARQRSVDEVIGLELGADDYIRKPFDVDVVLARVRKALRQAAQSSQPEDMRQPLIAGELIIEPLAHRVTLHGKIIALTPLEYEILFYLARRQDEVVGVDELISSIWGAEYLGQPQVVYVHIRGLREKIEADPGKPQRVKSVRGIGYMLVSGENQA